MKEELVVIDGLLLRLLLDTKENEEFELNAEDLLIVLKDINKGVFVFETYDALQFVSFLNVSGCNEMMLLQLYELISSIVDIDRINSIEFTSFNSGIILIGNFKKC